jgi:aminopeptidase N
VPAAATRRRVWPGKAYQRFKDAGNMTDRRARWKPWPAPPMAEPALQRFHACSARPAGHRQVVRAAGRAPRARRPRVRAVKALLKHPDFTLANPNRARA